MFRVAGYTSNSPQAASEAVAIGDVENKYCEGASVAGLPSHIRSVSGAGAVGLKIPYRVASNRNHARRSASSIQTSIRLVVA